MNLSPECPETLGDTDQYAVGHQSDLYALATHAIDHLQHHVHKHEQHPQGTDAAGAHAAVLSKAHLHTGMAAPSAAIHHPQNPPPYMPASHADTQSHAATQSHSAAYHLQSLLTTVNGDYNRYVWHADEDADDLPPSLCCS